MSEFKTPRAVSVIQKDYQDGALRAGHIRYQMYALERDLNVLLENLRELNFEAAAAQKAEAEAAKAAQEKKVESEKSSEPISTEESK